MNRPATWLRLHWPREFSAEQAVSALHALHSLSSPRRHSAWLLETVATGDGIAHYLMLPDSLHHAATRQLRQALPGLATETAAPHPLPATQAARVAFSTGRRPLAVDRLAEVATGLLAALEALAPGELAVMQWWLGPKRHPVALDVPAKVMAGESLSGQLLFALLGVGRVLDSAARAALLKKQGIPGWRAVGRIAVRSDNARRLSAVAAALSSAQGPGARVSVKPLPARVVTRRRRPWLWPLLINAEELVALGALPAGETDPLPVLRTPSRLLPPDLAVGDTGRIVGVATFPGAERPLALNAQDGLRHLHVLGPTGTGKSTLLLNLIVQDLALGHGVVVIEPKGDLIEAVLARVPKDRTDDVVVLDPTDLDRPVGFNPLRSDGPRELAVDHMVSIFKNLFSDSWGPRTEDILAAGLLTLSGQPGATLVQLPLLFLDPGFQRHLRSQIQDQVGLGSFWQWYDALPERERATVLAPLMNKLRQVLLRPAVRTVVGQAQPRLDLGALLAGRGVLLVNACRGSLGPGAASLLGSLLFASLWQAVQARDRAEHRPVFVYIDEFQDYLHLPTDLGEMLALSRSQGVGMVLAHQHLGQLGRSLREGVLANTRSRIAFQLDYDDARTIARGRTELAPEDLMSLPAFEAYAALCSQGTTRRFASLRTVPAPAAVSDSARLRALSRDRYGVDLEVIEAGWKPAPSAPAAPIGTTARRSQGGRR